MLYLIPPVHQSVPVKCPALEELCDFLNDDLLLLLLKVEDDSLLLFLLDECTPTTEYMPQAHFVDSNTPQLTENV